MKPRQLLSIFAARYKVILLLFCITTVSAVVVSLRLPVRYVATASVLVDVRASDPFTAMIMPASLATQVDIINSDRVTRSVIKALKIDEDPAVKQLWLADLNEPSTLEKWFGALLQKDRASAPARTLEEWLVDMLERGLTVTPSRESSVITIGFRGQDPAFAAAVANAYAQSYINTVIDMKVGPAKQYVGWFEDQAKVLRDNMEQAQGRLFKYQQSKGIVERQEQLDYETTKLRELSSQLTVVQAQTNDSRSKQKSGADTLPEIMGNALITGLKSDIARREATLQETAVNLGRNHPQYQKLESEIASLKEKLEAEIRHATRSYATASTVGQSNEAELKLAIEAQKRKLLGLKSERNELDLLQRDADAASRAYDGIVTRMNQTALESESTRANVSLLAPALVPRIPSSPKPLGLMLMISISLGLAVGFGTAFLLEMFDRRIRSVDDLAEMVPMPVLGVIVRSKSQGRLPTSVARLRLR